MIEERYLAAMQASHLRDEAHKIGQVDIIKASGMSSRTMAAHAMRLISRPRRDDMERVYFALLHVADQRKLVSGDEAVKLSIEWLMQPTCPKCNGTGVVIAKGVERKCWDCDGEGEKKMPSNQCAQILIDYVLQCKKAHASRMLQKLR